MLTNQSIHPRVVAGRTVHRKVNTTKRRNPATVARVIAAISAHVERHPRDGMSQSRLAKLRSVQ